ncbi:MAG: 3-ketoacyl-ACP reductase [Candidatus Hydrogenedentes bacterium]|nr:3-ketoacyl-ACP reductase [Candidatus Hydrogenedentota bacterium]
MAPDLVGTAFVTGASRGIGRGIALELAKAGFDIVAAATTADPGNRTTGVYAVQDEIEALGRRCLPVAGNIASTDDHARMLDAALDTFGAVDVLVNNAGVAPLQRLDLLETTPESFDRLIDINLRGPFFFSQRVANSMIKVEGERSLRPCIIFVTSISADTASPNRAEYCISKAGLSMAAQNFAVRLAEYGINVYEVRPGIVATDMTIGVKEKYDSLIGGGLLLERRWGAPDDIGRAVAALATGSIPYATGGVFTLDGGFGIKRL